jgi:hypothetical protein
VWTVPPAFDPDGMVLNVGESLTTECTERIEMEASPWVLTFAAAIGGILAHLLQRLVFPPDVGGPTIWIGLVTAMLLSGIGTILLSRLATTDFLLVVKVKDFWGAIATGFVIQWLGYSALTKLIEGARVAGGGG